MPETPKSIVHIRPDTIGDLVIFSSALAQLQAAWPEARHVLVVRPGYETLAPLFPAGLHWQVAAINPFKQTPAACRDELAAVLAALAAHDPDLVLASTLNRTWLEVAVAAHFPAARRVSLGTQPVDPLFATALRLELGIDAAGVFTESVPTVAGLRDWEQTHRLVEHLLGGSVEPARPALAVPAAAQAAATTFLEKAGLPAGGWAAMFPAGLANVPIKAWPAANFGEVVAGLQRERGLPVLLLGHETERPVLEAVSAAAVAAGGTAPAFWLGKDGEIALLAALLREAQLYVGNDTGAMHIAAAVDRPTLGIFGGGHWPRFRPVGRRVVSVVHPLPCFGCGWDCQFGHAPCVKAIGVGDVLAGLDVLLAAGQPAGPGFDRVIEARNVSAETWSLIEAVTPRYRALQGDRIQRQHTIEELKREADTKDTEIDDLKRAAEERKVQMEAIKAELEAECATKDTEIATLKTTTEGMDAEIESLKAETNSKDAEIASLKAETNTKDSQILLLKGEADRKDEEIGAIKHVADLREELIQVQDAHIKRFQATIAAKDTHIENLETGLKEAEARRAEIETVLARLPSDAAQWAQAFHDKDVHIRNLDGVIHNLRGEARERDAVIANYAADLHALEGAKHYGKLLADKEAVIQTLHKACVERERVIRDLAAQASGFGPRLTKLWSAAGAHWRLKIRAPFDEWLFKKVVEDHWMQIGILRHYEPRPLVWDRLPKPKTPDERLPRIAIVTPSFGQQAFIESTMLSVLNQPYPKLAYVVQDGGSRDKSPAIIARYADRLAHWESARDRGQADAVVKGFKHLEAKLAPDDVMAWLNSDDLLAPRALALVGDYFARHPEVDVIYGHRIIIDTEDRDVGRWIMPPHDPKSLEWIDYVPQETMFWRKRAWDRVGGVDPSFQFALDWDLLARFLQARCRIVRIPYFLGCFRVHSEQKTSQAIHTVGAAEMEKVRRSFHGDRHNDFETINAYARKERFRGALTARLHALGIRW